MAKRDDKELVIMLALFDACVQQSTTQIGQYKGDMKLIFKKWYNTGMRLRTSLINGKMITEDELQEMNDVIFNSIKELREAIEMN